ncbi:MULTISPECIES: hypothetical protein [Brucella]|uniref:hypothetical protein n=1 Tax=Brucella TaxID=234 RepID=UPI00178C5223|nr:MULTISPECIES: hypothetical protein [Brucella]
MASQYSLAFKAGVFFLVVFGSLGFVGSSTADSCWSPTTGYTCLGSEPPADDPPPAEYSNPPETEGDPSYYEDNTDQLQDESGEDDSEYIDSPSEADACSGQETPDAKTQPDGCQLSGVYAPATSTFPTCTSTPSR